jgi:hypothetical protein
MDETHKEEISAITEAITRSSELLEPAVGHVVLVPDQLCRAEPGGTAAMGPCATRRAGV